jgi:hypothetical protein
MYWQYLKYILRHKWFVFSECRKDGITWRGITHDLSKFRPSEFIPYARYFYGDYPEYKSGVTTKYPHLFKEDIGRHFDKAWLKHIHRNPHHWQHWLLQEDDGDLKNIPIPPKVLKEMVCDWRGAGRAIAGTDETPAWYLENMTNISLEFMSQKFVEKRLGVE